MLINTSVNTAKFHMSRRNVCSHPATTRLFDLQSFPNAKVCTFKSCDKTCSKMEKNLLLLVYWVTKKQ